PVLVTRNQSWKSGMGSSIKAGVAALIATAPAIDGVLISVCDQPYCDATLVRRLVDEHGRGTHQIIAAYYDNHCAVPALFDRALVTELLALDGREGARQVIQRHEWETLPVHFPAGVHDVDTPEDLVRLQREPFTAFRNR